MKKFLFIILVILVLPLTLLFAGCETKIESNVDKTTASRLICIESTEDFKVFYDRFTKVMYVSSTGKYNRGNFTVLVDAEGKPLLYEEINN